MGLPAPDLVLRRESSCRRRMNLQRQRRTEEEVAESKALYLGVACDAAGCFIPTRRPQSHKAQRPELCAARSQPEPQEVQMIVLTFRKTPLA